jgi:hypothetical protein
MTHNHPPQDPTETKTSIQIDLEPSTTTTPKKNSNMRSRWKQSSRGQSKTPSTSSPSFGIVEQPLASPKPESQTKKPEIVERPEPKLVKTTGDAPAPQASVAKPTEEPLEKSPGPSPRLRAREEGSEAPRRFPRSSESTQHRPHSGRQSFNRPPLRKEQSPKDTLKSNMDYEPSRASAQKKQSLEDAILKTQEPSFWNKIKQFFAGLFSKKKPEIKPRGPRPTSPRNAHRPYQRNRNPYYSRNPSRGRKES